MIENIWKAIVPGLYRKKFNIKEIISTNPRIMKRNEKYRNRPD
ncbi:MAG: hypothetical protein ACLFQK_05995 [Fibrobacterota bacterium]